MVVELDHTVRSGGPYLRARGMIPRSVHMYGKAPTRQFHSIHTVVSRSGRTQQKHIGSCHPICKKARTKCGSPPHEWFLVGYMSPFMRLAEHLAALRA